MADLRAPTPTAAAEMVSNELSILFDKLNSFQQDIFDSIQNKLYEIYQKIDQYEKRLLTPQEKIKTQNILIDNLSKRIQISMLSYLKVYQNEQHSYLLLLNMLN